MCEIGVHGVGYHFFYPGKKPQVAWRSVGSDHFCFFADVGQSVRQTECRAYGVAVGRFMTCDDDALALLKQFAHSFYVVLVDDGF